MSLRLDLYATLVGSVMVSVTAMSPLQFQKQLQLQEARRLMLGRNLDATSNADFLKVQKHKLTSIVVERNKLIH